MENHDATKKSSTSNARLKFSDGAEPYEDHKSWKYDRWAWEFLRRSSSYQDDCEDVARGVLDERFLCDRWGLRTLKPYAEGFRDGKKPKFKLPFRTYSFKETDDGGSRRLALLETPGQLLILFSAWMPLEEQIEIAKRKLQSCVSAWKSDPANKIRVSKVRPAILLKMIKAVDAKNAGQKTAQIGALICSHKPKELWGREIRERLKRAREYMSTGYQVLALKHRQEVAKARSKT